VVSERRERRRRSPRQLRYLLQFRGDVAGTRSSRHLALQQFRVPARPSLHRVPLSWFPGFVGTTTSSDFQSSVPSRFVAFTRRLPSSCSCSLPLRTSTARMDLDPIIGGPPESSTETVDLPGFWRTSRVRPAPLFDPGGTFALRPNNARRCCVRLSIRRTLPSDCAFEARSRSSCTPCVRFAATVARSPRNTRFRVVATFPGQRLNAARFVREVSVLHPFPSPRLRLAHMLFT
jgi:hypothetical protein